MPMSVFVEGASPDGHRLMPNADGSLDVLIQEPLDVVVTNFPASTVAAADIVSGSRTSTGTLYTVPAGRVFSGSVALSACVAVAGSSQPTISTTDGEIHRVVLNGLALSSISIANSINDVYVNGGVSGKAVTFTQGASGTSTGQISGRLL